jgi:rhodanese-related sulfurtransferase
MIRFKNILLSIFISLFFINKVLAIPPPDFIISSLQSVMQILGIIVAFFISLFFLFKDFLKNIWTIHKKKCLFSLSLFFSSFLLVGGWIYSSSKKEWKQEVNNDLNDLKNIVLTEEVVKKENIITQEKSTIKQIPKNTKPKINELSIFKQTWEKFKQINEAGTESENHKFLNEEGKISVNNYNNKSNKIIIDLRETQARLRGKIPESLHIRLTDFLKGGWKSLNIQTNQTVIFVCFTGSRGSLATEFFRNLGYENSFYLDGGINKSSKDNNFNFEGDITLGSPYNIQKLLTTEEVKSYINNGVIGIDVRADNKFEKKNIPKSIHLFRDKMITSEIQNQLNKLDSNKKYFAICDSWLNCYSAKILGFEMMEHDLEFIGRYAKPYEY